jgi:hypothetical protein
MGKEKEKMVPYSLEELQKKLREAAEEKDTDALAEVIAQIAQTEANDASREALQNLDAQIMVARGVRQLTQAETEFYQKIIDAQRGGTVKQEISDIDLVMPETIINNVMDDIAQSHDLLSHLDIQHVNARVKVLFTTPDSNIATWGKITDKITQEITYGFEELDATQLKLTAYIPVPQAYLDLGPSYIDTLTRTYLYEAIANGIEKAVLTNLDDSTGPIAMTADIDKGSVASGVTTYTEKTAVKVTNWTPKGLAAILTKMAKTRKGNPRALRGIFAVVTPEDYLNIIKPAISVLNASGEWVERQPYPITFVQSAYATSGKAIFGLDNYYILGITSDLKGRIETSDEYQFLDDVRVYKIKMYGNGTPKDNNAFQVADISGLKEAAVIVTNATSAA